MFIINCNSRPHQIKFNIYMEAIFKLHGVMTGSVGSERKHVKYVSRGGQIVCSADNPFYVTETLTSRNIAANCIIYKLGVEYIYREPTFTSLRLYNYMWLNASVKHNSVNCIHISHNMSLTNSILFKSTSQVYKLHNARFIKQWSCVVTSLCIVH